MNDLYRGVADVSSSFAFDDEVLKKALENIYSKDFHPMSDIERNFFNAVWSAMNEAVDEGSSQIQTSDHDTDFLQQLKGNNAVFAAFKVHRTQRDMARLLADSNGNLKPFEQWVNEVMPIADHQMRHWLKTEYDTAVIRAHHAADWQQFLREKDIFPNLKWVESTSINPGADHRIFWNTVLPIEHPFWNEHRPGDRWNCKCDLISTDEEPTDIPETAEPADEPQRGLKNNPGKDGIIFSDNHPYFPSDCKHCAFYKPTVTDRLKAFFTNRAKDCYNCPYIKGCIDRVTAKQETENAAFARKQEVKERDLMPKLDKEPCSTVITGTLNRTNKVRNTFLKHCHHDYDVDAAVYIWNKPDKLKFIRVSPLGEGKDMSLPENQANIRKKREELHFVQFHQYEFTYKGRTFEVKLALCQKGYEQFYSLKEK